MLQEAPPPPRRRTLTRRRIGVAAVVLGAGAFVAAVVIALTPESGDPDGVRTIERGGLAWDQVMVDEASGGTEGSTLRASVTLDGAAFPTATSDRDRFVLFQLGPAGRFDSDEHVDDSAAERVIGLDDDDTIQIIATANAGGTQLPTGTGEYSMSLDGTIEYRDIPAGTWVLRSLVVARGGLWDGQVAEQVVEVA